MRSVYLFVSQRLRGAARWHKKLLLIVMRHRLRCAVLRWQFLIFALQLERTPLLHRPMSSADPVAVEFGRRLERESEEHHPSTDDEGANTGISSIFSCYLLCFSASFASFLFCFCFSSFWCSWVKPLTTAYFTCGTYAERMLVFWLVCGFGAWQRSWRRGLSRNLIPGS